MVAIALSLSVMIITVSSVRGFKKEISEKMFGFWGHVHITHMESNKSFEDVPIQKEQSFYPGLDTFPEIDHIQIYAQKAGIIKTETEIEGIVLKGIGPDYDWDFLKRYLIAGEHIQLKEGPPSKDILISNSTAKRLRLKVSDPVDIYFVQDPPRVRRFRVKGIYKTGLEEYDRKYALVDIKQIQKLNNWTKDQVGGFEVFIADVDRIEEVGNFIYFNVIDPELYAWTIKEMNPTIFDWLNLQGRNEQFLIILMLIVAIINVASALLVLILDRTNMIGILKALGATNWVIRQIFIYNAIYILALGLIAGNVLGIGLCLLQQQFEFIKLSEESYYMTSVPIYLNFWNILILNMGTLILSSIVLILPTYLVSRIDPIQAIRWN